MVGLALAGDAMSVLNTVVSGQLVGLTTDNTDLR